MIRVIDATELKTAFPLGEYVRTECVQATIDHMQTIESIPIEWLEELIKNGYGNICNCAETVLVRWRNENALN